MDYKIAFYMLLAFIAGRLSKIKIYIGQNKEKYNAANIGLYIRPNGKKEAR